MCLLFETVYNNTHISLLQQAVSHVQLPLVSQVHVDSELSLSISMPDLNSIRPLENSNELASVRSYEPNSHRAAFSSMYSQ